MEERKIGEIITFDGKQFQVVEGDCEDCYFNDKDCTSSHYDDLVYVRAYSEKTKLKFAIS